MPNIELPHNEVTLTFIVTVNINNNVELELALAAIQNCLNLLYDDLGPVTKELWLINQWCVKRALTNI